MELYQLKRDRPAWMAEPASNRQRKVLRFFDVAGWEDIKKGPAGGIVGDLLRDKEKSLLWEKYCFVTGDLGHESEELLPYDLAALHATEVPNDWKPAVKPRKSSYKRRIHLALEILEDGSPFDYPIPQISVPNSKFVFTGNFTFGSRSECSKETQAYAGAVQKGVNKETDFLVIGDDGSDNWQHANAGRKILKAIVMKIDGHPIKIITEGDWIGALQDSNKT